MAFSKFRQAAALLVFLAGIFAGSARAAPVPSGIEGTPQDGAEIVIRGSGFGQKAQPAPIMFDTQDEVWINGQFSRPYQGLPHGTSVPKGDGYPWVRGGTDNLQIWTAGGYARYGATFGGAYTRDAWIEYPAGFPDPGTKEVKEVYIRWWFKMSGSNVTDGTASSKFIRVWDTTGSDQSFVGGGVFWDEKKLYPTDPSSGSSWVHTYPIPGQWNLMELYIRTAPNPYMGAWMNGERKHDVPNFVPPANVNGLLPRLWGLDGSGDANFSGKTLELSDYYADSTRARVEIGNAANWSDVTIREPQVATAWSAQGDTINVRVYQGRLDSVLGGYLYVIDADGNVNQTGFPLDGVAPPAQMPPPAVQ